jgi:NADH-quinone oxidoreductase subunit J
MNNMVFTLFWAGLAFSSAIGVLLAKRIVISAFSLFALFISVAGIFGSIGAHVATVSQIVLYVGGVMILVAFALFLSPENEKDSSQISTRKQNIGKAFFLLFLGIIGTFFIPFNSILTTLIKEQTDTNDVFQSSFPLVGKILASEFSLEFELLGLLLLAALVLSGWYLKTSDSIEKK